MDLREQVAQLERALERLGVEVRRAPFDPEAHVGAGGLCRLRGAPVVVLDAGAPPAQIRDALLDAVRRIGADGVWLPPILREAVEKKS